MVQWTLSLVYIRPAEVPDYYAAIVNYVRGKIHDEKDADWLFYAPGLQVFFNYMLETWIGEGDVAALYDSDHWSVTRSLVDPSIPTTSNGTEAYNQAITKAIGNSAKRFWRTVQAIQDEEAYSRYTTMSMSMLSMLSMSMSMSMLSLIPPPLRKKLKDIDNGEMLGRRRKRRRNKRLKKQARIHAIVEASGQGVNDFKEKLDVLQSIVGVLKSGDGDIY